jgi:hypothetical protein
MCLHILLIAAAIQGTTPDPPDLASIKPLGLVCKLFAGPDTLLDAERVPIERSLMTS